MDQKQKCESMDEFNRKEKKALIIAMIIFALISIAWLILQAVLPEEAKQELVRLFEKSTWK